MYPLDLPVNDNTSYFKISIVKKEPRPLGSLFSTDGIDKRSASNDVFGGKNIKVNKGTIILPMPLGVSDGNDVAWSDGSFNFLESTAADTIQNIFGAAASDDPVNGVLSAAGKGREVFENALRNANVSEAALKAISSSILRTFGSSVTPNQLLSRTTGQVLNPNLELLFDGPTLRNHEFSFQLTPRSKQESDTVKKIIYYLKRSMAAGQGETMALLNSPYVFELSFMQGREKHPFLFSMKTCGMKGLNVNYSASTQENYSSYWDGSPTSLTLSMMFTELSPVYRENYEDFEDFEQGVGW